jgi:hypothetical protein
MNTRSVDRRRLAVAGGAVLIAVGVLTTACGTSGNQAPTTTSTTTSTTATPTTTAPPPSASPTEKSLSPNGPNLFTPQITAPAAPTEPPGVHHNH